MSFPGAPQAVLARSLALRAAIALVLMAGFYALAVAMAGGLLWLPYAEWRYAKRVDARLLVFAVVGAFLILQSIVPRRDAFVAPGPRLGAEGQPRLFTELAGIASAAAQEMPAEVVPDVNAWVSQRGGVLGLGSRRIMGVGFPLLQAVGVSCRTRRPRTRHGTRGTPSSWWVPPSGWPW